MTTSKEQLATLKKQLEEAQRLRDRVEKARVQAKEDKAKVEKEEMRPSSTVITSA